MEAAQRLCDALPSLIQARAKVDDFMEWQGVVHPEDLLSIPERSYEESLERKRKRVEEVARDLNATVVPIIGAGFEELRACLPLVLSAVKAHGLDRRPFAWSMQEVEVDPSRLKAVVAACRELMGHLVVDAAEPLEAPAADPREEAEPPAEEDPKPKPRLEDRHYRLMEGVDAMPWAPTVAELVQHCDGTGWEAVRSTFTLARNELRELGFLPGDHKGSRKGLCLSGEAIEMLRRWQAEQKKMRERSRK